jgi:hypothetical protein
MPYQPVPGPVRPFHEDENIYQFRFFCDKDPKFPIEKNLPKSNPSHFCSCGAVMSVEIDGEGPCLRFSTPPESHLAARLFQSFETLTSASVTTPVESLDEQMKGDDNLVSSANAGMIPYALYALVGAIVLFGGLIFAVHLMS